MTKESVFICDVTGDQYPKDDLVPIKIEEVSPKRGQANELAVTDGSRRSSGEHVAQEVLSDQDLQSQNFETLEIIICGEEVVGYRDYSSYVDTKPKNPTDKQQQFLRELTHLPEHELSCQ